jgi:hypothetical protein
MSYSPYKTKDDPLLDLLESDVEHQRNKKTIVKQPSSRPPNSIPRSHPRRGRSVAVVEGVDGIESQALDDQSTVVSKITTTTPPQARDELPYNKIQQDDSKSNSNNNNNNNTRRAKWIFWACLLSQLITIGSFVGFLTTKGIFVEESAASEDDNGETTVMIGINDTYQVGDEWLDTDDIYGDDFYGNNTLCQYDDNTTVSVQVDKECYELGVDPIVVFFENCAPEPDDWIGIYDSSYNIFEPGMYRVDYWSWACGNQECQDTSLGGEIVLIGVEQLGSFRVHLHRREGTPEEMYLASSQIFIVAQTC